MTEVPLSADRRNAKGKPTNSEFIAMIADRLVLQRRNLPPREKQA